MIIELRQFYLCLMIEISRKLTLLFLLFISFSCTDFGQQKEYPSTPLYDLNKPKVIDLPEDLDEISGIAYYAKDTSVFAISDDNNFIFKIPLQNPKNILKWSFDKTRDYEEVVLVDSTFYVLVSKGDIMVVNFDGNVTTSQKIDFSKSFKQSNEFESLYYSPDIGKLVLMCKDCDGDKKGSVSTFLVDVNDTANTYTPSFKLDMSPVNKKLGLDKHLKPSAAAINPVTGDLYVLSTIQSLLLIATPTGTVKEYYKLNPGLYKQAEGIAFTPEGDMIIANEFAETGFANLLLFRNKLKQ